MSLGINATTTEGMILAADSRQSYRNQKGMARIGSDSATKIFKLSDRIGLIVAGVAFLPENGVPKNISNYVEEFIRCTELKNSSIDEAGTELSTYFKEVYAQYAKNAEGQIKADLASQGFKNIQLKRDNNVINFAYFSGHLRQNGQVDLGVLELLIAGYNPDGSHKVKVIIVPHDLENLHRDSNSKNLEFGSSWIGQKDVVSRIILGFDPRMENLSFMKKAVSQEGKEEVMKQIGGLQYSIQWGTMTLQDAIDFAKLAIETTSAIQRFSDGTLSDPGDMPGVGGPIDLAVISPKKGFVWISKKNLCVGNREINLDNFNDLDNGIRTKEQNAKTH